MGTIEIDISSKIITIEANIICYGNAASYDIALLIAEEIETMWSEPNAIVELNNTSYFVRFIAHAQYNSFLQPNSILENQNPKNNYFRIEEYSKIDISCVDAIGSNTGYFKLANLYKGSTTAAHEFGHSLGLIHPKELNIVGKGRPSIMYPRGSWVDQQFQNDVIAQPGGPGGTLNPQNRRVMQVDIDNLQLNKLIEKDIFVVGKFTNQYHDAHVKEDNA
jgi:hypothetical protein